jgi:hypothetical protein
LENSSRSRSLLARQFSSLQERERNNNMRSGDGIWRIEPRDLEQF